MASGSATAIKQAPKKDRTPPKTRKFTTEQSQADEDPDDEERELDAHEYDGF